MSSKGELFDTDTITYVAQLVESKADILRNEKDFMEKDKILALSIEDFEKELTKEQKDRFDKVIKLMYQVEEYYIALAYSLGTKYGENLEKM